MELEEEAAMMTQIQSKTLLPLSSTRKVSIDEGNGKALGELEDSPVSQLAARRTCYFSFLFFPFFWRIRREREREKIKAVDLGLGLGLNVNLGYNKILDCHIL